MKKFRRLLLQIAIGIVLCIILMELAYRNQWWDFYATEWEHFNQDLLKEKAEKEVLVMGDSFSTSNQGYVEQLRDSFPTWNIANGAVPGTGIQEANYMASGRFSERQPQAFIYQIYLGNDLFDLERPVNWGELGFFRNLYWWSANRLRSLAWINYKSGQLQAAPTADGKGAEESFAPERYNQREKRYFNADPAWMQGQADAKNEDWEDLREWYTDRLEDLLDYPEEAGAKTLILVIPHCAQLGNPYQSRMETIGMESGDLPKEHALVKAIEMLLKDNPNTEVIYPVLELAEAEELQGPVYFQNDPHLNPRGQEVIAKLVGNWLKGL